MTWLVVIVLAPLVFMIVVAFLVLKVAAFGLRVVFAKKSRATRLG